MKLSKLSSICKKRKRIVLFDDTSSEDNVQWAGDGAAFYELTGLPEFSAESLFTALGFDLSDKDCWILNRRDLDPELINTSMSVEDDDIDATLDPLGSIVFNDTELYIFHAGGEKYLFNKKYFSPLKIDENFSAVIRTTSSCKYLVTFSGMFPTAIICPVSNGTEVKDWLKALGEGIR